MKALDLTNVTEAGTGSGIKAGGYVCKYTVVTDMEDKQYLWMEFDVVEGEFTDYFKKLDERAGFWGGKVIRSYKEKALPMFKRMCSAVTKSNPGYIFDGGAQNANEASLVGKLVGIVLGEEEYQKNDGTVGTRTYVFAETSVDDIRKGNFKIPALKKLEGASASTTNNGFMQIPATEVEELPFT